MEQSILASGSAIKSMGKVSKCGQMDHLMRDNGKTIKLTDMVSLFMRTEMCMRENG